MLAGGAGTDTVTYATAGGPITVNLSTTTAQNTIGSGSDTLTEFENLTGSAFNDTLTGNGSANVISGLGGNDIITGGGGADTLFGGVGADRFIFTALSDSGPASADTISDFLHGTDIINVSAIDANTSSGGNQTSPLQDRTPA